jgi:glutathione S-transferase
MIAKKFKATMDLFLLQVFIRTISCFQKTVHLNKYHCNCKGPRSSALSSSWSQLENELNVSFFQDNKFSSIDSTFDPLKPVFSKKRPTLFRERNGWCPYSERVFLALELSGANYDTVKIDNTGHGPRPYYFGGQTPQVRWPDGSQQGESMDLVYEIDKRFAEKQFKSNDPIIQEIISQFSNVFPSRARPSSRAAYLFQYNGEPIWKSSFEETLGKLNEMLDHEHPFFANQEKITAADIFYAPFLERYRYQLPCLHQGLDPADASKYPYLSRWYQAMDKVPVYACRVKGDASSWRKVLTMAGFGNAGVPHTINQNMSERIAQEEEEAKSIVSQSDVWEGFRSTSSYALPDSPFLDAATIMTSNRKAIVRDAAKGTLGDSYSEKEIDAALHGLVSRLIKYHDEGDDATFDDSNEACADLAAYLDERMCVPRDMGSMSAATIKRAAVAMRIN